MFEIIVNNFNFDRIMWSIKRRLVVIILCAIVGGVAGGGFAMLTRQNLYRASVSMYVYSSPEYLEDSSANITGSEYSTAINFIKSYLLILKSDTVMQAVIDELGLNVEPAVLASMVSTVQVEKTPIFYIYVSSTNAEIAMRIANAMADIVPNEIVRISKSGGVEVIDYATLPEAPTVTTQLTLFTVVGFAVGLFLSLFFVILAGLMNSKIRKTYELTDTFTIPVLGDVPKIISEKNSTEKDKIDSALDTLFIKEHYNAICTNMLYLGEPEKTKVFAITSSFPEVGKTLTTINIGINMAKLGKKVLIIDCDLRNPSIEKALQIETKNELSEYLAGINNKCDIVEVKEYGIDVVTAGSVPPNPAELLASHRFSDLLEQYKENYDYIILDLPPVYLISDALIISNLITGYILVARALVSKIDSEKSIVAKIDSLDGNILGYIMNDTEAKKQSYGQYGYGKQKYI